MWAQWALATEPVGSDEDTVKSTLDPVRDDGPAEAERQPEFNSIETDDSGELQGLAPRTMGAYTIPIQKYVPWWLKAEQPVMRGIDELNESWSDKGTAAARERAGVQGHGTMQIEESLEPVIRDGGAFGNDYFVRNERAIQDGAGQYMEPITNDSWPVRVAQARGTQGASQAAKTSMYRNAFAGVGQR